MFFNFNRTHSNLKDHFMTDAWQSWQNSLHYRQCLDIFSGGMWYAFHTGYHANIFSDHPFWVKAIRTAGSTADRRFNRHYWLSWKLNFISWFLYNQCAVFVHTLVKRSIRVVKVSICYIDSDECSSAENSLILYFCAAFQTGRRTIFTGNVRIVCYLFFYCPKRRRILPLNRYHKKRSTAHGKIQALWF